MTIIHIQNGKHFMIVTDVISSLPANRFFCHSLSAVSSCLDLIAAISPTDPILWPMSRRSRSSDCCQMIGCSQSVVVRVSRCNCKCRCLVAPSSSKWNECVAVSRVSLMKLSNILCFSTRCETVVAVPMFVLGGHVGIVT